MSPSPGPAPTQPRSMRDRIKTVLADGVSREVREICDLALTDMTVTEMADALTEALPHLVRSVIHEQSRPPLTFPRQFGPSPQSPQGEAKAFAAPRAEPPLPVVKQKHIPSAKVTAIRNHWWEQKLRDTRQVEGRRKVIAEFTADDALAVGNGMFEQADRDRAEGVRFIALAKAIKDAGVEHARDLPADVGYAIWNTKVAA